MDWLKKFGPLDFEEKTDDYEDRIEYDKKKRQKERDQAPLPVMSRQEVSQYSSMDDVRVIIGDYIYDLTKFLKQHPGGEDIMFEHMGRDITVTFTDVGHSKDAKSMLHKFRVAQLPQNERIPLTGKAAILNDI